MPAAGVLTCRINAAFKADPVSWVRQRSGFLDARRDLEADGVVSPWLTARTVKFFADGVIEAGTGFLLEPYEDAPHSCGLPNWSPDALKEAVRTFDADGFQIHIHAIGDAGVRMALDAIEHAALLNGARDRRPVIAHTQLVHPDDRARFAALGVIANFEPLWACLDGSQVDLTLPRLGPARSSLQYPIATLARLGAPVSFGSDWPVSSHRPLDGLAVAVDATQRQGRARRWLVARGADAGPRRRSRRTQRAAPSRRSTTTPARWLSAHGPTSWCSIATSPRSPASEIPEARVDETWVNGVPVFRR